MHYLLEQLIYSLNFTWCVEKVKTRLFFFLFSKKVPFISLLLFFCLTTDICTILIMLKYSHIHNSFFHLKHTTSLKKKIKIKRAEIKPIIHLVRETGTAKLVQIFSIATSNGKPLLWPQIKFLYHKDL